MRIYLVFPYLVRLVEDDLKLKKQLSKLTAPNINRILADPNLKESPL